jgi:hypothetical protein
MFISGFIALGIVDAIFVGRYEVAAGGGSVVIDLTADLFSNFADQGVAAGTVFNISPIHHSHIMGSVCPCARGDSDRIITGLGITPIKANSK